MHRQKYVIEALNERKSFWYSNNINRIGDIIICGVCITKPHKHTA
jgi:hypothetical protein